MGDLDAPGVPDGAEDRLLVVPPDSADLKVVIAAESTGCGPGDTPIHQDQLESAGDTLSGQVLQHQLAGPVLVGGGGHDQRGYREAGHVDGYDPLGALGATVGAAAVVEGEPAVGCAAEGGCR